jgi:2-polyprenyl-3-methyl-5-hydroxy-6-metoxy-1,4-benzoquinol methylase
MPDRDSLPTSYFEARYQADIDPWKFRSSDYEKRKYQATIGALTRERYRRGLEVGCSIGVLTAMLAARCDDLLALDVSETAIREARSQRLPNVSFEVASLPHAFPAGSFDLIVLSEMVYYLSKSDLEGLAKRCVSALQPDGEIILCHWLGETDYPLTGHQASDLFAAAVKASLPVRAILHDETYRLERLSG